MGGWVDIALYSAGELLVGADEGVELVANDTGYLSVLFSGVEVAEAEGGQELVCDLAASISAISYVLKNSLCQK